jgi:hypothetical protein
VSKIFFHHAFEHVFSHISIYCFLHIAHASLVSTGEREREREREREIITHGVVFCGWMEWNS